MKALGAEIYDFVENGWPDGYVWDTDGETDPYYGEDGKCRLGMAQRYDLAEFGWIYKETKPEDMVEFAKAFAAWRKQQTTACLAVECPKEKEQAVRDAIRKAGGKVRA